MHNETIPARQSRTVGVLLFDQFSNHCLANTIEPLRAANTLGGKELYHWRYLSLSGGSLASSSGLSVAAEELSARQDALDLLFVMPSYGYRSLATPAIFKALRQADKRTKTMVGMDTGAWLFAAAGLLSGKRATIHSAVLDDFAESFLSVDVQSDRFVSDGKYTTCGGAMAAFDLALHLIGQHHGAMLKQDVETFFLYQGESSELKKSQRPARANLVKRALQLMDENLEQPITIEQIASQLSCNVKELQRRFNRSLSMSPSQVFRHKRLSHAKTLLLSTQMPISEVTVRCGYENASAMTRAFKAKFGTSPMSARLKARD